MKKILFSALAFFVAFATLGSPKNNYTITVVVKQMITTEGNLRVTLFNSEADWLSKGELQTVLIDNKEVVTITFENVPEGTYGVSVIHDSNGNGELDANSFGMPVEDYGFSNDARGMFGPPSFSESKFEVKADQKIIINIK